MLEKFNISGKHFLISGVTSGIGLSLTRSLIGQGAFITGIARNSERLTELEHDFPNHFFGMALDLNEVDTLESKLSAAVVNVHFDGFVHSAGLLQRRPLKLIKSDLFSEMINVNVVSGTLILKTLVKNKSITTNASVVFLSSVAANYAAVGNIMYMASKGAVNSLVKGLAFEMAKNQIRVNGIEPGLIKTHLTEGISDEEIEKVRADYPLGRLGQTEDIISGVQYLLSPASSWITGHLLRIDGGLTLR
jgi:NAD(P)-dependent dehydrogenase (short-subunit alcohol dehydrogenase family)